MTKPGVERGFRFQVTRREDGTIDVYCHDGVEAAGLTIDPAPHNDVVYMRFVELQHCIWMLPTTRKPSKLWLEANGVELDDPDPQ